MAAARRRRARSLVLALALAAGLIPAGPLLAGAGALVQVHAVDARGRPVASDVRLEDLEPGGLLLSVRTHDGTGVAVVSDVPPGTYRVTVVVPGATPAPLDLSLAAGDVVGLRVDLGSEPLLRVAGRHRASYGVTFDAGDLRDLPAGPDVTSLPSTADAFVIGDRIDNGGLYPGEPLLLGAHGSSWTQASFAMGALDVTDPVRGGTPLLLPVTTTLSSVSVTSALAPVEVGPPGVRIDIEPHRPSGDWRGSVEARFIRPAWQGTSDPASAPTVSRYESWSDGGGAVSGPLASGRLRLLAAAGTTRARRREQRGPELEGRVDSLLTHAVARLSRGDDLRLLAAHQRVERPFAGRALYQGSAATERDRLTLVHAAWERRRSGAVAVASLGFQDAARRPDVDPGTAAGVVERLLDGPVAELAGHGHDRRRGWDAALRLVPDLSGFDGGRHVLRLGANWSRASLASESALPGGPIGETVNGLPARLWDYAPRGVSRRSTTRLVVFAADRVALTDRLQIEAGARIDFARGRAAGASDRIAWRQLSPRVAARWQVPSRGRLALLAAYGRYAHRLLLQALAFGDPEAPHGAVHRWQDADGDGRVQPGERGARIARIGPGGDVASVDPELRAPRTDEVILGLEVRPASGLVLRFTALHRAESGLIESVNRGVGPADYVAFGLPDPYVDFVGPADDGFLPVHDRRPDSFGRDRYVLTNPPGHDTLHQGFELSLERTGGRLRLLAGAAAYRSDGATGYRGFRPLENDQGVIGELYDDPNSGTFSRGRLFFDRNYVIKLAGSWRGPAGWRLGAVVRYQDGQPFARVVVVPDLSQGPEALHAVPEGRHRFTYTLTVDARIEKQLGFLGSTRLAAAIDAFNLLDTGHSVEEDVTTRPAFRDRPDGLVQPPRAVRLGVRLEF